MRLPAFWEGARKKAGAGVPMRFARAGYARSVNTQSKTTVRATRFVECPFSAVIDYAQEALRQRENITVSAIPAVGEHVHVAAQVSDDISDPVRRHDALLLAWRPFSPLFPNFHGALTVRPKGRGAWLRIQGSYDPPFGIGGRIFDALVGRRIAELTLARLLREIAQTAEQRWRTFRAGLTA